MLVHVHTIKLFVDQDEVTQADKAEIDTKNNNIERVVELKKYFLDFTFTDSTYSNAVTILLHSFTHHQILWILFTMKGVDITS